MAGSLAWRERKADEVVDEFLDGPDRFVDWGIVLVVVEKDPNGEELLPGKPRMRVRNVHRRGGIIDTHARPRYFIGPSVDPVVWFTSPVGEELVLHPDHLPPKLLVEGAMGAGKTTDLGQWLAFQAIDLLGIEGEFGATAPTNERTTMIQQAIQDMWPEAWWRWKERDRTFSIATGHTIRLVSTHRQSKAEGSRVQGYNWLRHAGDELQDSYEENGNIDARGRDAPDGIFKRFNSVTVKDDPGWRSHKDKILSEQVDGRPSPWGLYRKSGPDSPFVPDNYWLDLRSTMTDQEYRRKVGAEDVPSEKRTYYAWDRKHNIRPRPVVGAKDATSYELSRYGHDGVHLLLGHDPGLTVDVTLILKAFQLPNRDPKQKQPDPPSWWVVGEVVTERRGTEGHCLSLAKALKQWNQHHLIYCDPHGVNSKNDDDTPDITVINTFRSLGFNIRPAAYAPGKSTPGQVPREARIDMVNTLLCDANGNRRLFVDCDATGKPAAPNLVRALEQQERAADGRAERDRKGTTADLTHHTCALGYALWPVEKPRLIDMRRVG